MPTEVITASVPADVAHVRCASGLAPLDEGTWLRHRPARHLLALRRGACVARCSIWADATPRLDGESTGVIGHYAALDAAAGAALLRRSQAALAELGRRTAIGPMDGNTWRTHRFVTRRGDEPPFFLEPDQPDDWPAHFEAAGFAPLATYVSALNRDLAVSDPRVDAARARFEAEGGRLRTIDLHRFEDELRAVHALSAEAFARNFLYAPIDADEFLAMYAPLRDRLRSELVWLAERGDDLVGFMFGVPDLLELARTGRCHTVLAKSLAVRPGRRGAGLGGVLMDVLHQAARRAGYTRVIHALMHQDNALLRMSSRYGTPIREYTLFARRAAR